MLRAFFEAGLAADQRLANVLPPTGGHCVAELLDGLCDVQTLLDRNQLVLDAADAYVVDGTFDGGARVRSYREATQRALDDGFSGYRVFNDVGWLLPTVDVRSWRAHEVRADLVTATEPLVVLCGYGSQTVDGCSFDDTVTVHGQTWCDDTGHVRRVRLGGTADGAIAVTGELDAAHAEEVGEILDAVIDEADAVVDLAALDFVDGAGAEALFHVAHDRNATLRNAPQLLARIWTVLGFDEVHPLEASEGAVR